MPRFWVSRHLGLVVVFSLLSIPAFAQAQENSASSDKAASAGQEENAASTPATTPSDYAGAEVCKTCHADEYTSWENSPHWNQTNLKGGIAMHGCEDCHGAAASHIADPTDTSKLFLFDKASSKDINARCLTCHAGGTEHMNATNSLHRQSDVSCTSCHSPHHAQAKEFLLVKAEPELCYSCHLQQKSQFDMPFHHRVNEGLIQCTDCHNAHGTGGVWESDHLVRQVRTSDNGDAVCFKCHKDKQGPFVFPHCSVKLEGCATCHIPHGGANPHMLKYASVNLLCLQCHTAAHFGPITQAGNNGQPTGFAVMNGPVPNNAVYIQACTMCHTQIHGSNFSDIYFR